VVSLCAGPYPKGTGLACRVFAVCRGCTAGPYSGFTVAPIAFWPRSPFLGGVQQAAGLHRDPTWFYCRPDSLLAPVRPYWLYLLPGLSPTLILAASGVSLPSFVS